MKKLTFVLIFSSLMVTYSQEYFKYCGERKKYFNVSPSKILVYFPENTEIDTAKSIISRNTLYQASDVVGTSYKGLNVVSFSGTNTEDMENLLQQWKNTEQILYSGPVFVDEYRKTTNTHHFTSLPTERSNPEKNKNEKKIALTHNIKKQTPFSVLRNENNKIKNETLTKYKQINITK